MVMKEEPKRRDSYVLNRGAYDNRGERVEPGTPAALPDFPELTRRVIAWVWHVGCVPPIIL